MNEKASTPRLKKAWSTFAVSSGFFFPVWQITIRSARVRTVTVQRNSDRQFVSPLKVVRIANWRQVGQCENSFSLDSRKSACRARVQEKCIGDCLSRMRNTSSALARTVSHLIMYNVSNSQDEIIRVPILNIRCLSSALPAPVMMHVWVRKWFDLADTPFSIDIFSN